MACKKIFWEDPYLRCLDTEVNRVTGNTVTLKETIIFAMSGGQDSDDGTINGLDIIKAEKQGTEIYYIVPDGHGLASGDTVHLAINWEKRYNLMKLHFAAELILELVYQLYGHPEKIGANITAEKARLDFNWEGNITAIFPVLLERLGELVNTNSEIQSRFSDAVNEIRYWEIKGFARVPCGGTHLKRTGEIGAVNLRRRNIGRGRERIEIELADNARNIHPTQIHQEQP